MSWNEPGGGRDPWSSRGSGQGPPDLDEVVRKLQQKLGGLFGSKGRPSGTGGSAGGSPVTGPSARGIGLVAGILFAIWALSGIYIVAPAERGVVLRFGHYTRTTDPGPHWRPRFIESVQLVNVEEIRSVPLQASMLTQDENIISVALAVQYRVKDARDYLFNVRLPDETLTQVSESALREVIGKSKLDFVLTEGRSEIVTRTDTLIQEILDRYVAGVEITSVNLQDAQPPDEVQSAFEDAIKAREDEQRLKNEAEAYANEIIPIARGNAARQLEDANAYREQVVARAEGEASRFSQLLAQYVQAPQVTRERLYLETMETVLSASKKVLIDVQDGNNLVYLPLDKIMEAAKPNAQENAPAQRAQRLSVEEGGPPEATDLRDRRGRR